MTDISAAAASSAEVAQLAAVRNQLLRLHKILLDAERVRYERANGRVTDMFQLLNLTIHDPAFAWLRPLSTLIVEIDEKMEDKEKPLTTADVKGMRGEIRVMLTPSQTGDEFQRNYHWALQETAEAVIAHSETVKALNP
jgi:hypothetical protein